MVADGKVVAAVYVMPEGYSWGRRMTKGLVPRDESHWTSPAQKLLVTRQFTGRSETYRVEPRPN